VVAVEEVVAVEVSPSTHVKGCQQSQIDKVQKPFFPFGKFETGKNLVLFQPTIRNFGGLGDKSFKYIKKQKKFQNRMACRFV